MVIDQVKKLLNKIYYRYQMQFQQGPFQTWSPEYGNITYYDWSSSKEGSAAHWFHRFIRHHFPDTRRKIKFYSIFGNGKFIQRGGGG